MQNITIIIGLPGSGKTTYLENNKNVFKNTVSFDDYHKSGLKGHSHLFEDSIHYDDFKKALQEGKDVYITDIGYCQDDRLVVIEEEIKKMANELSVDIEIKRIYFENNPEACKKNIHHRNRESRIEREIEYIDKYSSQYCIPNGA